MGKNQLFLWQCSIAMLNYQRVPTGAGFCSIHCKLHLGSLWEKYTWVREATHKPRNSILIFGLFKQNHYPLVVSQNYGEWPIYKWFIMIDPLSMVIFHSYVEFCSITKLTSIALTDLKQGGVPQFAGTSWSFWSHLSIDMSTVNLQPSELSNWGTTMIYIYIYIYNIYIYIETFRKNIL